MELLAFSVVVIMRPSQVNYYSLLLFIHETQFEYRKIVLVLKEIFILSRWQELADDACFKSTLVAVVKWNHIFIAPKVLMSEQDPLFIHYTLEAQCNKTHTQLKPTVPFISCANDTVESLIYTVLLILIFT